MDFGPPRAYFLFAARRKEALPTIGTELDKLKSTNAHPSAGSLILISYTDHQIGNGLYTAARTHMSPNLLPALVLFCAVSLSSDQPSRANAMQPQTEEAAAQSSSSSSQSSSDGGKSPAKSPTAAGSLPSPDTNKPEQDPGANKAQEKKKSKKVWTNDEMANVSGNVSVVGSSKSSEDNSSQQSQGTRGNAAADAGSFHNKLEPLRSQLNEIDQQIQQMRNTKGAPRENVESQVQILQGKREKIQARIDEIEEDARRHGIQPGDLR